MAIIWVHINPVVSSEGTAAKGAFTPSAKQQIEKLLVKLIDQELPAQQFSTDKAHKPKGTAKAYDAIKVTAELALTIDTAGSRMTVASSLKLVFEAIRMPNLKPGNLLGSGSKGATVENRGTGEKSVVSFTKEALDIIVAPLVKLIVTNKRFRSYGESLGLPFNPQQPEK